ncbi:MAG: DUF3368 domain-containing protein [Flavobacteriales bacterium]|nr:DUF3368 domain-containing protein [Flavobacteriales bacterium]MEB2341418.1 DUF3368 domain-containing protein [Flavobacteriia bacterium]
MPEVIIADTSCLITLANIDQLGLLKLVYSTISITPEVAEEYGADLPDWFTTRSVRDSGRVRLLELQVDRGEATALALAMEVAGSTLIVDDLKARKLAGHLGI